MTQKTEIDVSEVVRNMTISDFKSYLHSFSKHPHLVCSVCSGTKWTIHSNPEDNDKPIIITLPIPFVEGVGVWCFFLMCSRCGKMNFINTNKVAEWVRNNNS